jgi:hypothetical protein
VSVGCGPAEVEEGAYGESWENDDAAEGKNSTSVEDAGDTDAPEIWECTISVRQSEDIISLWNRVDDARVRERIRCVGSLLFFRVSFLVSHVLVAGFLSSFIFIRTGLRIASPDRGLFRLFYLPLPSFPFVHFAPSSPTWLASLTSALSSLFLPLLILPYPSPRHS